MEVKNLTPVKVTRVTSNDRWPLIYIPKEAVQELGLKKGQRVLMLVDHSIGALIIKPVFKE
ncbi:MAG: AbrB/MazE/SpoVT family DNA-binding domain-containing protein [Candidatus Bathyarchaeia archaeon]